MIDCTIRKKAKIMSYINLIEQLSSDIANAALSSFGIVDPTFTIEKPDHIHGDYATNVAMTLASSLKIVYLAQTQLDNNVTLEPNSFFDGSVFNQLGLAYFAREYSLIHGGSQDCLKEVIWEMTLERATGMTFAEACNSHAIENAMHEFEQALPAQEPENMGENEAFDVDWGF